MNKKIAHVMAPLMMDKVGLSFAQTVQALLTFSKMRQPYETIHAAVCNKLVKDASINDGVELPTVDATTHEWNKSYAFAATLNELKPHFNELYKTAPDPKLFQVKDKHDPSVDAPVFKKRKSKRVKNVE